MIDSGSNVLGLVVDHAHADARDFVEKESIDIEGFFLAQAEWLTCSCNHKGGHDDSWRESHQFLKLVTFVQRHALLRVVEFDELPKPGFASWLHVSSEHQGRVTGATIGIDSQLLNEWFVRHSMPIVCQLVRSILHELGHHKCSPQLLRRPLNANGFSADASEIEEEKAWVYAFVFLAVLAGDYARECRRERARFDRDDVPRIYI